MDPNKQFFRPQTVQVSQFHYYSLGVVAENKALSSDIIFVTPTEEFTMLDGELRPDDVQATSQGKDVAGNTYSTSVQTSNAIKATWLRLGFGNRLTAPDVRTGAEVVIYQFGDSNTFYWTTLKDDHKLRKLETVIWGFSGTKDEGAENDHSNMYYLELSTHNGMVTFHTSKANGEFCTYDFQFNTKEGKVQLTDDVGNYFLLDSQAHTLRLENVDGSFLDFTKEIGTMVTKDQINMKTKTWQFDAETANLNLTTTNLKGTTLNVTESTTDIKSPTTKLTATTTTVESATLKITSASMEIDGAALDVKSLLVTFDGASFIVVSPIIVLG